MPRSEKRTITCLDCGQPYETARANTKFCAVCRLQKDIEFVAAFKTECWMCKKEFSPIRRGETACGDCAYDSPKHGITECVYCEEERPRVAPDVAVCNHCARAPERRHLFRKALKVKVADRYQTSRAAA